MLASLDLRLAPRYGLAVAVGAFAQFHLGRVSVPARPNLQVGRFLVGVAQTQVQVAPEEAMPGTALVFVRLSPENEPECRVSRRLVRLVEMRRHRALLDLARPDGPRVFAALSDGKRRYAWRQRRRLPTLADCRDRAQVLYGS